MTNTKPAYVTKYVIAKPYHPRNKEGERTAEFDPSAINMADFAYNTQKICNELHDDGYDIISMIPITRGPFRSNSDQPHLLEHPNASTTQGVVIVAALDPTNL